MKAFEARLALLIGGRSPSFLTSHTLSDLLTTVAHLPRIIQVRNNQVPINKEHRSAIARESFIIQCLCGHHRFPTFRARACDSRRHVVCMAEVPG